VNRDLYPPLLHVCIISWFMQGIIMHVHESLCLGMICILLQTTAAADAMEVDRQKASYRSP